MARAKDGASGDGTTRRRFLTILAGACTAVVSLPTIPFLTATRPLIRKDMVAIVGWSRWPPWIVRADEWTEFMRRERGEFTCGCGSFEDCPWPTHIPSCELCGKSHIDFDVSKDGVFVTCVWFQDDEGMERCPECAGLSWEEIEDGYPILT